MLGGTRLRDPKLDMAILEVLQIALPLELSMTMKKDTSGKILTQMC
jgi:flagellar motility protein MotE (MotC chaperone)